MNDFRTYRPTEREKQAISDAFRLTMTYALIGGISLSTLTFQMLRNAQRNSRLTLSIFSGVSGFTLGGSFGAVKATDALLALEDSELADHYRKMIREKRKSVYAARGMKAPEDISGTEGTPKTRWDEIRIASSKPSTENSTHEPQPESHTEDPFLIGDSLGNNTDKGNKPKLNKYGDIIE